MTYKIVIITENIVQILLSNATNNLPDGTKTCDGQLSDHIFRKYCFLLIQLWRVKTSRQPGPSFDSVITVLKRRGNQGILKILDITLNLALTKVDSESRWWYCWPLTVDFVTVIKGARVSFFYFKITENCWTCANTEMLQRWNDT